MKRDEVTSYAKALIHWSPAHAADHAARRRRAFSDLGDQERAKTWDKVEKRILSWETQHTSAGE